jgi:hypothetical protein
MQDFHVGFDPGSLAELTRLEGFGALLDPQITAALTKAGELIVTTARANTWAVFANPTGQLADSIYFWVVSPTEVDIAVGVPYGRRRELGFSGMTDSIGRYYPYDPGKPYAEPAVEEDSPLIEMLISEAVYMAFGEVGVL